MKGAAPETARIDWQQVHDTVEHLAGGFVRESEKEDVARIDSILEQVGDAISQGARLAGAGAGNDEKRPRRRRDRSILLRVQVTRVIDADRRCGRSALEGVLAGHGR